ncbi:MAG: hypothetical protein AAB542_00145 [Patescibacteria group bacterium]|mgnify:FL=1
MPKKTKKEKLLAQQHRTNLPPVVIQHTSQTDPVSLPATHTLFTLPNRNNAIQTPQTSSVHEYKLMKHDLIKTVILTSVILVSEFLLARSLPR